MKKEPPIKLNVSAFDDSLLRLVREAMGESWYKEKACLQRKRSHYEALLVQIRSKARKMKNRTPSDPEPRADLHRPAKLKVEAKKYLNSLEVFHVNLKSLAQKAKKLDSLRYPEISGMEILWRRIVRAGRDKQLADAVVSLGTSTERSPQSEIILDLMAQGIKFRRVPNEIASYFHRELGVTLSKDERTCLNNMISTAYRDVSKESRS